MNRTKFISRCKWNIKSILELAKTKDFKGAESIADYFLKDVNEYLDEKDTYNTRHTIPES